MDGMTCPRRLTEFGPWARYEGMDEWRAGRCSFCGSLNPDEFMARVERGEELIPTDKTYKAYVGPDHQKFYYPHLSQVQRTSLITLANERLITFGEPGYWYVLPHFIRPA